MPGGVSNKIKNPLLKKALDLYFTKYNKDKGKRKPPRPARRKSDRSYSWGIPSRTTVILRSSIRDLTA